MAGINLKHFVDVNIKKKTAAAVNGSRGTMVLFTTEGTAGDVVTVNSIEEAKINLDGLTQTLKYLNVYFNHNGVAAKVIEGVVVNDLTAADIAALPDENIVVGLCVADAVIETAYGKLQSIAVTRANDPTIYGINEKVIVARTAVATDDTAVKNFAVKYSHITGAEMTMAGYMCKFNAYDNDVVYDYSYTQETINPETITDATYETLAANNMNVDVTLARATRNLGGNLKNGDDLINNFVRIVLHQTLTERLLMLLAEKIKNQSGIAKIYSTIIQELNRYVTNGYLTTDKVWTDETLVVRDGNGNTHTIIEKGTGLVNGFVVKVLPFNSLTDEDKAQHKAPAIYIVIADQYGIRKITIQGEVI